MNFYDKSVSQTLKELKTGQKGLTTVEANLRIKDNLDKNIDFSRKKSIFLQFLAQFKDLMIIILLIAAIVSIAIGIVQHTTSEIIDGGIILGIVLMNAIFGLVQERKAEKALEALKKMTQPEALVFRDGKILKLDTKLLVPGDVILLESGSIVAADVRLISSRSLLVDESSLTGESHAVLKDEKLICPPSCPLAEQKNMAFKGSTVCKGSGEGVVVAVGKETEFGKIAVELAKEEKGLSPLQQSIKSVGKLLTFAVLGIAFITFWLVFLARPNEPLQAFLTAVAISVAAIPESMPAVITIIMSLGIARLAKQKAVVKKLSSVETLGCCDVICSDKTGTITENKMTVKSACVNLNLIEDVKNSDCAFMAKLLSLCTDVSISNNDYFGDPTEIALCKFARGQNFDKRDLDLRYPRLYTIPFDSDRKCMTTINLIDGKQVFITKGALDKIISKCKFININGKICQLNGDFKEKIRKNAQIMTSSALRVIAVAYKDVQSNFEKEREEDLVFVGFVGMIDRPRRGIKQAVKKCRSAGMRPIMITGDHKDTAFAIAKEIGLASSINEVMIGTELQLLSDSDLDKVIENISVFARVSPQDKVRIVSALKRKGHVVAMTGDGVNDAPSLKNANIGIGMGLSGTDVAKEAADIIVTDDNFSTIVVAVEEGRKIYQNIQKAVKFLFSANMGELFCMFLAAVFFPQYVFLSPVQILFVNLITDSLPAIALGLEPPERDLMQRKPRNIKKGLFADGNGGAIFTLGLIQTFLTLLSFYVGVKMAGQEVGTTMAFYTLNIIQMFYLASIRTDANIFKSKPQKNKFFFIAILFSFGLLGLFALTPLHEFLKLSSLNWAQWGIIFGLSFAMLLFSEVYKIFQNKKYGQKS